MWERESMFCIRCEKSVNGWENLSCHCLGLEGLMHGGLTHHSVPLVTSTFLPPFVLERAPWNTSPLTPAAFAADVRFPERCWTQRHSSHLIYKEKSPLIPPHLFPATSITGKFFGVMRNASAGTCHFSFAFYSTDPKLAQQKFLGIK